MATRTAFVARSEASWRSPALVDGGYSSVHADASRAVVTLDRGREALTVTIRDDGKGASEIVAGNGIKGMRKRAAEWGGQ